jgi:predicted lipoprotein with Yx(FWY)xxD motif
MKPAPLGVMCGMKLRTASALAALAATLVVAGCGSDAKTDTASSGARQSADKAYGYDSGKSVKRTDEEQPGAESVTGTAATVVKAAKGSLGTMLADAKGRTLYLWEADQGAKSACDGPCADAWPPLTTDGKPSAGEGVKADLLGTSKRADGTLGVTYAGHPLYYFTGDTAAGQANGQDSDAFGADWYVVSPAGSAIEH